MLVSTLYIDTNSSTPASFVFAGDAVISAFPLYGKYIDDAFKQSSCVVIIIKLSLLFEWIIESAKQCCATQFIVQSITFPQ